MSERGTMTAPMASRRPHRRRALAAGALVALLSTGALAGDDDGRFEAPFNALAGEYSGVVLPLVESHCLDCHSSEEKEGELDLERFGDLAQVRRDPRAWQKVVHMVSSGEMPPAKRRQLTAEAKDALLGWARRYLDAEARARAGDPGRVVLRRLSNAEYTYTVRDLTGVGDLDPAREFPVDGAAGEGFTNTGDALAMSPALVTKYLDAAKGIAEHAVLLPDGFRFSRGTTRQDHTNELLGRIRGIYVLHTSGDADMARLNRWDPSLALTATDDDGRVDLTRYFEALIRDRESVLAGDDAVASVAASNGLNAKYLGLIAAMLRDDASRGASVLLDRVRSLWRDASAGGGRRIASDVRSWQERLWRFNAVGHLALVRPWQVPSSALTDALEISTKLEASAGSDVVTLTLSCGTAGDGTSGDVVEWRNARLLRAGRPSLALHDVRPLVAALERRRDEVLAATRSYLAAAFEARERPEDADVDTLAAAHGVDRATLAAWLAYLGIGAGEPAVFGELLATPVRSAAGYDFVRGWTLSGVADLSLVTNASDMTVNIPGDMNPHAVAVHPRPERWIAAGWRSSDAAAVRVTAHVVDAHAACGNGVAWSLEHRSGSRRRLLASGAVDNGGRASHELDEELSVRRGDLIALVIGSRDRNHVCDLTEIDLTVSEVSAPEAEEGARTWSLAGDCADSIDAGNPHADRYGNEGVWRFFTAPEDGERTRPTAPAGSLAERWLEASDASEAAELASRIAELVEAQSAPDASSADRELRYALRSLGGPLVTELDTDTLLAEARDAGLTASDDGGIDPARFGVRPDGAPAARSSLIVEAPSRIDVRLPAALFAGAELIVSAWLDESSGGDGSVQLEVNGPRRDEGDALWPGVTVLANEDSAAAARFERSFGAFRELFPAAMCYARIVPLDEAVTLVLFHREDEHLARLMLDEAGEAELDRLWDELHFVSRDALAELTALEQILEFATQDADPSKFDPVLEPIHDRAAAFHRRLIAAEPAQLDALVDFAALAYRRPLSEREAHGLRAVYHTLRAEEFPHEEAFRLTLARVLTAPAFLYRLEQPGPGASPTPVSDWELATRLSYFLWSSAPDAELRRAAAAGELRDPERLVAQARRMVRDERVRRLAIEFACQWLHIRDFDTLDEKSERHFPSFAGLRASMYEESIRFFTDLFQGDRSVLDILDGDATFLDGALAEHYGIPGVSGEGWRRVEGVKAFARGGVLAQATTLSKQSGASRTSPILRGNWISETLLGERLPRPPKDVPQLPETVPEGLTERQLIERHASDPACAKCHLRIDPYGFALESFDAIGRHRTHAAGGQPIDTRATLPDGAAIDGLDGLRRYLATTRRADFVRQLCRKLLGYALGREVTLSDEPLLAAMAAELETRDWRFGAALETIVRSPQFRDIRGADATDDLGGD